MLAPIIDRALAPSPGERFQTADEMEEALRVSRGARGRTGPHPYVVAGAALAALVAGGAVASGRPSPSAPAGAPPVVAVSRFMSAPGMPRCRIWPPASATSRPATWGRRTRRGVRTV